MKLRQRFRKALFAFFKEEILKEVSPPVACNAIGVQTIHHSTLNFRELRMEWRIADEREFRHMGLPVEMVYEEGLRNARKRLFDELMPYVQVDERTILDPNLYDGRVFRATLFVAEKQNTNPK